MQNDIATTTQCPNEECNAINNEADKYCQRCGTPLSKRYLWAVGEGVSAYKVGDIVQSRYLLTSDRIFVDTKPGTALESHFAEINYEVKPYLRLVPYRLHVPQAYGFLPSNHAVTAPFNSGADLQNPRAQQENAPEILLLENAAIYASGGEMAGQLMPELASQWQAASSLRQLNWLWQIAGLWQPLCSEGVASSLLEMPLLRVEQSQIRLLQLKLDVAAMPPTLAQLGQLWQQLLPQAKPAISEYLAKIIEQLIQEEISHADDLVALLDRGIAQCGRSQMRQITISTRTDTGPSRQRNEDACYPPSGTLAAIESKERSTSLAASLTIVCDGIGGHEGGNVASNLAIETVHQQIEQLNQENTYLDSATISSALDKATHAANERISDRNDSENRQGRQRMGTTLVMALAHQHEVYIAHVGDSRGYIITRTGCHQVTLDDDVAAREVRLGYCFYRDALLQPSSGSLIQALGMSLSLHPTVERFILDEDCIFLLCSDGLSDYDRIEQHWETELLPVLEGKTDLASATSRLIEIANTHNGHDNVTVGLVHCQVKTNEPNPISTSIIFTPEITPVSAPIVPPAAIDANVVIPPTDISNLPPPAEPKAAPTQLVPPPLPKKRSLLPPILLGLFVLLSLGGLAYWLKDPLSRLYNPEVKSSTTTADTPSLPASEPAIVEGSILQIATSTNSTTSQTEQPLLRQTPDLANNKILIGIAPGSIVQVVNRQNRLNGQNWLEIKVCNATPKTTILQGWILETEIAKLSQQAPVNNCLEPTPATTNSPKLQPTPQQSPKALTQGSS